MPESPVETYVKDPDAVLDYAIDWATNWLEAGETISSHTVTVPAGITKDSDSESAGTVTIWLSGGTAGSTYRVTCQIVTSSSRTDDRSFDVLVSQR